MSREQMRKLLSEPTEEDRLRAENEELHRVAEQATELQAQRDALLAALRAAEKELASGDPASALRRMQRAIAEVEGEK